MRLLAGRALRRTAGKEPQDRRRPGDIRSRMQMPEPPVSAVELRADQLVDRRAAAASAPSWRSRLAEWPPCAAWPFGSTELSPPLAGAAISRGGRRSHDDEAVVAGRPRRRSRRCPTRASRNTAELRFIDICAEAAVRDAQRSDQVGVPLALDAGRLDRSSPRRRPRPARSEGSCANGPEPADDAGAGRLASTAPAAALHLDHEARERRGKGEVSPVGEEHPRRTCTPVAGAQTHPCSRSKSTTAGWPTNRLVGNGGPSCSLQRPQGDHQRLHGVRPACTPNC